ncbi:hypothetical protein HN51_053575 [Arachis hypogaea]
MHFCLRVTLGNFPNMLEAHVDIDQEDKTVGWVLELLQALRKTKLLALKLSTTVCLLRTPAATLDFPEFSCLRNLDLEIPHVDSELLIKLLHNCPMLKVLSICRLKV